RLAHRFGLPSLLLYLAIGVLLGEDVARLRFDNADLARLLGLWALVLILAEGGLTTRWSAVRGALPLAAVISTAGVAASTAVLGAVAMTAYELAAGALIGLVAGWLGVQVLRRSALPVAGLYPLATIAFTVMAYSAAVLAHASGFIAVYLAGLVLGNSRLPHRH